MLFTLLLILFSLLLPLMPLRFHIAADISHYAITPLSLSLFSSTLPLLLHYAIIAFID
jgi:hypothetical protein